MPLCVLAARKEAWLTHGSCQLLQMALQHFGRVSQEKGCYYKIYVPIKVLSLFNRFSHKPVGPDHPAGVPVPQPQHPYRTLGCVFNHRSFYANCQVRNVQLLASSDL